MADFYVDANGRITSKKRNKNKILPNYAVNTNGDILLVEEDEEDIAPVKTTVSQTENKDRTWFQKSALFDDGYQFGDVSKTILGSKVDVGENIGAGIIGMGEKALDALMWAAPYIAQGQYYSNGGGYNIAANQAFDQSIGLAKEETEKFIEKDLYNEEEIAKTIISNPVKNLTGIDAETDSVFGEKSDALAQSAGQLGATVALSAAGVPWWVTTGATAFGGEVESALNQGATMEEAGLSAAITAGAEILTEKLSGGISFGGNTLDDVLVKELARTISNKTLRTMAKLGMDAVGEGTEEVISQVFSNLGSALYKEESLNEILFSEETFDEYIESFIGGAVLGGGSSAINAIKSNKQGVDSVTGLTANEQQVVDKVYEDRVAEKEKSGKIDEKAKRKIYDEVLSDLDRGGIDIDTIEEVLGGETYSNYKKLADAEAKMQSEYDALGKKEKFTLEDYDRRKELADRLKYVREKGAKNELKTRLSSEVEALAKGSRLVESYNEKARRGQAFEADVTQYEGVARESIEKIIAKKQINNTNKSHDVIDFAVRAAGARGLTVTTTTTQEILDRAEKMHGREYVLENFYEEVTGKDGKKQLRLKTVPNAEIIDGKEIALNVNSPNMTAAVIGHEIGHTFEGTAHYGSLAKLLNSYAKAKKGEKGYDAQKQGTEARYRAIAGADADAELNNDLLGEYIFSDEDFVRHLLQDRNVFQKVFDEIKYLVKYATAGSRQQRDLLRIQRTFEKMWREGETAKTNAKSGTEYSIGKTSKMEYGDQLAQIEARTLNGSNSLYVGHSENLKNAGMSDAPFAMNQSDYRKSRRESAKNANYSSHAVPLEFFDGLPQYLDGAPMLVDNGGKVTIITEYGMTDTKGQDSYVIAGVLRDQSMEGQTVNLVKSVYPWDDFVSRITKAAEAGSLVVTNKNKAEQMLTTMGIQPAEVVRLLNLAKDKLAQNPQDVKNQYSLADSDYMAAVESGDTETAQRMVDEAAKAAMPDSKIRGKDGNLIPVYHGTKDVFYEFDTSVKGGVNGTAEGFGIYTSDDPEVTEAYGNRQIKMYANITKPATSDKKTISPAKLAALIKDTCKKQAQKAVEDGEYDSVQDALMDTWVSNYVYTYGIGMERAYREVAKSILEMNDSDMAVIQEVMSGMAIRDYAEATDFYRNSLVPITGFDGFVTHWENSATGKKSNIYLAFDSSQLKSADAVTYDDNGNVIPLSERFDPEKKDIRNSLSAAGEQQRRTGRYNVPLNELALETAEDIAPMAARYEEPARVEHVYAEIERLTAEAEELERQMNAAVAAGDNDAAMEINADLMDMATRINELERQTAADEQKRLTSIEDEDAPAEAEYEEEPEFERPVDTVTLPKTRVDTIAKAAQEKLGATRRRGEIGRLVQDFSEGKIDRESLYAEIKQKFGEYTEKQVLDEVKEVQKWLRTSPVRVTADIKSNFADYYTSIHRPNFSKIAFRANEGQKVDQYYEELRDQFPEFFPADIKNPADQLQRIVEVANMDAELVDTRVVEDEALWDAVDTIARQVSEYRQSRNRLLQEKAHKESLRDLQRNGDRYAPMEDDIAPAPAAEAVAESVEPTTRKALYQRIVERVRDVFMVRGFDFDEVLKLAKNLSTLATVDNTPQRVMEKSLGYKEGQALADVTVNLAAQNETEGIRWLNTFTNKKNGLLRRISKQYGIKPRSKESAAAQMYAEGFYVDDNNDIIAYGDAELAADFPDAKVQENIKGLAKDPRIRQIYDETLAAINESRKRNLYPEIPRLDNYFLHFRAMDDTFSRLGLPFNPNDIRAKDLPTDLNGVTADLKPGQPYFASAKHRTGKRTSFDLLGGLEKYLSSAKNQIYHIDDIQTLRALRNYIADTFGQAHGLDGIDEMSEAEQQERIEEVFGSHLSTFAKFLNEEANVLAGKTALIDRGLEGIIGRRGMTFFNTLNQQVGANMVGFNVSSSLTNFIAVAQAFAKTNKADFIKAFAQTAANRVKGGEDSFTENSPVIIRRKGAERFSRTPWEKASDMGYVMMSIVDNLSTELIARTKFNELVKKGMSEQQAHIETDKWASRLMGDRSLGQMPQLYNSKMAGLITKFQLEVRNQLDSQFYDTIQEAKVSAEDVQNKLKRNAKVAAQVTSTFVQLAVVQHLFGKAFEAVAGYNPAFDIIEAIIKAFGWDDEEESEDTVLDNLGQGFMSLLEDMPYSSVITDGGRIPISSALPIGQFIKGEDKYGNEKSRLETIAETAPYYLLPGGYGQIKKTKAGLEMFDEDLPIAGSYTKSGNLRYPVEDTLANRVQAAVFGQYASSNARDYFDNERQSLKKNQIQELVDVDIPIREYWDYREGLNEQETLADKFDYIADLDLPIDKKNVLINNVVDRKEAVDLADYDDYANYEEFDFAVKNPEKYDFLQSVGVSVAEYQSFDDDTKDAYNWAYENPDKYTVSRAVTDDVAVYRQYTKALNDIKADKNAEGKSISGSRKTKVINYLNNLDADYHTKIILFKMEYNADDTYNREIIEYLNGRNDISFEEEVTILKELGFTVTADGTVRW